MQPDRDPARAGERTADDMEARLDELGEHIDTAKARAAEQDEVAHPDGIAGDWQDESAGSHQGDDAPEAFDDPNR
jgi:hypothetical protein